MKPKGVGRPKQLSRKPSGPKAEIQSGDLWGQQAGLLLKEAMDNKSWGYRQLSEQLAGMGIDMSPPTLNRRINRGNFTAGFLLMCLKALNASFEIRYEEGRASRTVAQNGPAGATKAKKPVDALEALFGEWVAKKPSE